MKLQRSIAYIIDIIVIGILSSILCMIFGLSAITLWAESGFSVIYNPVAWVGLGVSVLYFFMDVWTGGTIGKKIFRITVVQTKPGNSKAATAFIRALLKVISISLLFGIVLFLVGAEDSSFHDKIVGTKVSKASAEPVLT